MKNNKKKEFNIEKLKGENLSVACSMQIRANHSYHALKKEEKKNKKLSPESCEKYIGKYKYIFPWSQRIASTFIYCNA